MITVTLNLESIIRLTSEQFVKLCLANPDARLELSATGELVIMPPTGAESSNRNSELVASIVIWNRQSKLGKVFDSNGMFRLPNSAFRSPDASWISLARWEALTPQERKTFSPICPDFVVELRSESDTLKSLQEKMLEYINNGVRLGWLINPQGKQVEIYRIGKEKEVLENPTQLLGEDVLPSLVLDLTGII